MWLGTLRGLYLMTFRVLVQIEELIDNSFITILGLWETSKNVGGIQPILNNRYNNALIFIEKIKEDLKNDTKNTD